MLVLNSRKIRMQLLHVQIYRHNFRIFLFKFVECSKQKLTSFFCFMQYPEGDRGNLVWRHSVSNVPSSFRDFACGVAELYASFSLVSKYFPRVRIKPTTVTFTACAAAPRQLQVETLQVTNLTKTLILYFFKLLTSQNYECFAKSISRHVKVTSQKYSVHYIIKRKG